MAPSPVYYSLVKNQTEWSSTARLLLEKLIQESGFKLAVDLPIKIHTGEPGNISFIQPQHMDGMIDYLEAQQVKPVFMETGMANGQRTNAVAHRQIAQQHGFTRLPFIVADGEQGNDHMLVPIKGGQHFTECKIASQLNKHDQVLIVSHFKGHSITGFGGAIKMLGIGFASARGKTEAHAVQHIPDGELIDWSQATLDGNWDAKHVKWNDEYVYHDLAFIQRMTEYALAAKKPQHLHIIFATNLVKDCDCDGKPMSPLYPDLGIFASLDPVAIDKAILDMLDKRAGQSTYSGREVFAYAEQIGLGSPSYSLVEV